jgi:hypothetical protein
VFKDLVVNFEVFLEGEAVVSETELVLAHEVGGPPTHIFGNDGFLSLNSKINLNVLLRGFDKFLFPPIEHPLQLIFLDLLIDVEELAAKNRSL